MNNRKRVPFFWYYFSLPKNSPFKNLYLDTVKAKIIFRNECFENY